MAIVLMSAPSAALAADTVKIAKVVPYKDAAAIAASNLIKCDWNRDLSELIVGKSHGTVEAVDGDIATMQGMRLELTIVGAHTAGGGSISGPKYARIEGELREGGNLLGNFSLKRVSARPFTLSVCGPMEKIANALSDDIVDWLKNPTIDPNAGKAADSDDNAGS